ncbi:APC family permease [Sphingomonas sp. TX0543]|uniref:APC family permease n=1 Tax=unclassified Sphingomonas TaxID=196159 RepID=UPI0010F4B2F7|nr:APC family permease [Sphingomonas sp. 3P27F8]
MSEAGFAGDSTGVGEKGLATGAVGLFGALVIGVSCVAPAYTLTAGLGPIVSVAGLQTPAVILIGFLPMLLVAMGYRELNQALPDNGTTFTWVTATFGPWVGWMAGWGLVASTVLVLSNSAGVAVDFFYLLLAQATGHDELTRLADHTSVNILTCLAFMGVATLISYRGMEATKLAQVFLVGLQVLAMCAFAAAAFGKARAGQAFDHTPVTLAWFNPFVIPSSAALAAGLSLSIFIFWGWDVTLTMNEETRGSRSTPGLAAAGTVGVTMLLYLLASCAALTFAGIGTGALGLNNPETQRNVFQSLAVPVFGRAAILVSVAVLCSSAAALQSTIVSPSRTLLAMSFYGAMPRSFGRTSARFHTPSVAIVASTVVSSAFYTGMRLYSEHVLWDTITALGIMICFYYGLTAFSVVWFFRATWFDSVRNAIYRLIFPLLGGLSLAALFVKTLCDSLNPHFGSGSHVGSIGLVFVIGVSIFAVGLGIMALMALLRPEFFRAPLAGLDVTAPRSMRDAASKALSPR